MLFQGQEFGATTPFLYFSDMPGDLRRAVRAGRQKFLAQFPSLASEEMQRKLPNPDDPQVFAGCKLDFSEREKNQSFYNLFCDLIRLRREDPCFSAQKTGGVDGAVLGASSLVLRYFGTEHDRLLLLNLGERLPLVPVSEPLLAPPDGFAWETLWTTDSPRYGGPGSTPVASDDDWLLPAEAAMALHPVRRMTPRKKPKRRE
jgi:maltooligosyltrehalose trehalohydrolase